MHINKRLSVDSAIVILTGAGISQESGITPFRGPGGIYNKVNVEEVSTPEAFARNPNKVLDYYRWRLKVARDAQPNEAHVALAQLEKRWTGSVKLVTQNVDDLHERAGHNSVVHMHGDLESSKCMKCGNIWKNLADWAENESCPSCETGKQVRPNVVWFGETPYRMTEIREAIKNCDMFVSIGTSGNVYPASGFVAEAKYSKASTLELNFEPTNKAMFDEGYYGNATQVVPEWVNKLLSFI